MAKKSSKRFYLLHIYGSVDPSVIGKSHKTYDSLLKAARKFYVSSDFKEGEDGLFYLVSQDRRIPRVGSFDSAELEEEDTYKPQNQGFGIFNIDMRPPIKPL